MCSDWKFPKNEKLIGPSEKFYEITDRAEEEQGGGAYFLRDEETLEVHIVPKDFVESYYNSAENLVKELVAGVEVQIFPDTVVIKGGRNKLDRRHIHYILEQMDHLKEQLEHLRGTTTSKTSNS